jgi:hypothetical protein
MCKHYNSFDDVKKDIEIQDKIPNLLLGNGFSMAYDKGIFSYNALSDFMKKSSDNVFWDKLRGAVKTKNIELIMQKIDSAINILEVFDDNSDLKSKLELMREELKESLIKAISELHPKHIFKIEESKINACANFIKFFLSKKGHVFTTNYDLLLYWVLMRGESFQAKGKELVVDGFGWEDPTATDKKVIWGPHKDSQKIHYLHGALMLFDERINIVKDKYKQDGNCGEGEYLLSGISNNIKKDKYPIFVTAGNADEKLECIRHNLYLSHCYDQLCKISDSLVVFGFGFGDYDEHIIEPINNSVMSAKKNDKNKKFNLYVGIYSDEDKDNIVKKQSKFKESLNLSTFDASSASIWNLDMAIK